MRWGLVVFGIFITSSLLAMPFAWQQVETLPGNLVSIQSDYDQGQVFLAFTGAGALFRSVDSGDSWVQINTPDSKPLKFLTQDPSQNTAWYCLTDSNVGHELWNSTDNGTTWAYRSNFTDTAVSVTASPLAPGLLLGVFQEPGSNQANLRKSEDFGATWHGVLTRETTADRPFWHSSSLWQAYWGKFVSSDYGETWTDSSSKPLSGCSSSIPPQLLSATNEGLFQSTDNLLTWWPLLIQPTKFTALNPNNGNQILTGTTAQKLFYSSDGGMTFSDWTTGLPTGDTPQVSLVSDWMFFCIVDGTAFRYDERPADLDNTNRIDGGDLVIMSTAFGTFSGDAGFVEAADLNNDGAIDGGDLVILSSVFGHRFYYDTPGDPGDFPDN